MNLLGTIYAVDEEHINVVRSKLYSTPPPTGGGNVICMDMDETNNRLEMEFPDHCIKASLLCPPPIAMYKEIDGDQEGFINAYNEYLEYEPSVQDFIASILYYLHIGGHILLYTPANLKDDTLWMNILIMFFFTRFGISIGTSLENEYNYDQRYDNVVADILYKNRFTDVFDYINSTTYESPPYDTYNQTMEDLIKVTGPEVDPLRTYQDIRNSIFLTGVPIIKPAVMFG